MLRQAQHEVTGIDWFVTNGFGCYLETTAIRAAPTFNPSGKQQA